ncbi:MAG: arsenate reductase ArsC [Betaproteobacteria bacterium]|nr:arsenate reductase ArsC [Betaproteobacteria bacterium]
MSDTRNFTALFVCTHNSARSIMAEALLNTLGGGRFRAYSAGSMPKGEVHPVALKILRDALIPLDNPRSKSWEEFARPGAPVLDFVFTVCDRAAGEVCPLWPGQPMTAHWGVEDPAEATGTPAQIERKFLDAFFVLKRRIELLLSLPIESLDEVSLQSRVREIGRK